MNTLGVVVPILLLFNGGWVALALFYRWRWLEAERHVHVLSHVLVEALKRHHHK